MSEPSIVVTKQGVYDAAVSYVAARTLELCKNHSAKLYESLSTTLSYPKLGLYTISNQKKIAELLNAAAAGDDELGNNIDLVALYELAIGLRNYLDTEYDNGYSVLRNLIKDTYASVKSSTLTPDVIIERLGDADGTLVAEDMILTMLFVSYDAMSLIKIRSEYREGNTR